jgi:tight adherence protein B
MLTGTLVAAVLSGAAAAVAASPGLSPLVRRGLTRRVPRSRTRRSGLVVTIALLALAGGPDPRWWTAVAVIVLAVAVVTRIWRAHHRRAEAARTRAMVLEACESLVAELRAGRPSERALAHCMDVMPSLADVAAVARLGGDIPDALRQLAQRAGAHALRSVAAGWQIAGRTGASLAGVVEHVVEGIRDDDAARGEVEASLGPPRATARLLAVLPVAGIALGSSLGADPVNVLLLTSVGHVCLGLGVILALLGLMWVERIAATVGEVP